MFKKIALAVAFCSLFVYSAVNYPYPQRKNYGNNTINATSASASANLKNTFKNYMTNFYREGTCSQGPCARINFYDPASPSDSIYTVSEGIGYAMLMAVYFSDNTKSYQTEFDRLWTYYKSAVNSNGLMNWKIQGFNFSNPAGPNAASDAEFDVALALAMARYQFGAVQYETDAINLIAKIRQHEFEQSSEQNPYLHKPGDAWNADKNPSYVAPAAFEIFKELESAQNAFWTNVLSTNYTFLKSNQNTTTGLPSGWAQPNGQSKVCTNNCGNSAANYDQDAVRAPWRWATANAWFGHPDAKTLLNKLASWVDGKNPVDVKGPIGLSGTWGANANASYTGSLMNALTVNSTYQTKLNQFFNSTMISNDPSYFNQSMQILTALLASGNMPNLKACNAGNCGTDMPPIEVIGGGTALDRLDYAGEESLERKGLSALWEPWFAYTDKEAGYEGGEPKNGQANSTISNDIFKALDANDNCKEIDSYRVVEQASGEWAVRILSYTFDKGTYFYEPFVALGLDARNNQKDYDLSQCVDGFSYKYKGVPHKFKVLSFDIPEGVGSDHYTEFKDAAAEWTTVVVGPGDLVQPNWTPPTDIVDFDLKKVRGWAWELTGPQTAGGAGLSPNTGSFAIKDFYCLGELNLPEEKPSACGTPIKKFAQNLGANGAYVIKNGVSLQVAKNASIEVFNLNGKSMRKLELLNGSHSVMLGDLPSSLYIVKVKSGNQSQILRVPVK